MWETGIDPILNHAIPPTPSRCRTKEPTTEPESATSKANKRQAEESHPDNERACKRLRTQSPSTRVRNPTDDSKVDTEEDESCSLPALETGMHTSPAIKFRSSLLEMFSVTLLLSHATVCLIDRDRLQLYHANRSVILVSSAIDFSTSDGLDKFIAFIIAFYRLPSEQNGILDTLIEHNTDLVKNPDVLDDYRIVQTGQVLKLTEGRSQETFEVILGETISRREAIIGRSTIVVRATSEKWPGINLVVKISWPDSVRVPESKFLEKAIKEAEETDGRWAVNHLPRVFFSKDATFGKDSTFESVARLFQGAKFANRKFVFERRTLRIIIQEELYLLKSLTEVKDVAQVFVDIACSM